jgi:heme/copper-type cytochrome/quinol oxidase subunit 1
VCHNAFIKVRAPRSRSFTLADMPLKLIRFRSFINTIIKLLAALGLHAESLMALVDLAMAIE